MLPETGILIGRYSYGDRGEANGARHMIPLPLTRSEPGATIDIQMLRVDPLG
jgi:hypothetical protein